MIKNLFVFSCLIVCLVRCGPAEKQDSRPNMILAQQFGLDTADVLAQYYQKFGFTDVCQDLRMVAKVSGDMYFEKTLPISADDLKRIHQFSNKLDSIANYQIEFPVIHRFYNSDIELDYHTYYSDSLNTVQLNHGSYEIIQSRFGSVLKIFDNVNGLLYIESHTCDGT